LQLKKKNLFEILEQTVGTNLNPFTLNLDISWSREIWGVPPQVLGNRCSLLILGCISITA